MAGRVHDAAGRRQQDLAHGRGSGTGRLRGDPASELPVPTYAIDDETALTVTDGVVQVVSEGHWKLFAPR